jgi:hypothetical protein
MTTLLAETARDLTAQLDAELKQRRQGEKLNQQLLRQLTWNADTLAGITLSLWKWVCNALEGEGFEGRELAQYCRLLLEGIDTSLAGHERLVAMAEASGLPPESTGFLDLEAKLPALREARPKVAAMMDFATRTPRPVDEATLAASKGAVERGEFVTLDDEYLARLRAGEEF